MKNSLKEGEREGINCYVNTDKYERDYKNDYIIMEKEFILFKDEIKYKSYLKDDKRIYSRNLLL